MERNNYLSCIAEMLNTRSNTWDPRPEYVELLTYAVSINLKRPELLEVQKMLDEYYEGLHKYKPSPWGVTAERVRILYKISNILKNPSKEDIERVLRRLLSSSNAHNSSMINEAAYLLRFLHDNIDKITYHKSSIQLDEDAEF